MKKIGLLRENQYSNIAVLIPQNIRQLKSEAEFFIETNAGLASGYSDEDYTKAGATIVSSKQELIAVADLILSYSAVIGDEVFANVGSSPSDFKTPSIATQNPLFVILFDDASNTALCFILFKSKKCDGKGY